MRFLCRLTAIAGLATTSISSMAADRNLRPEASRDLISDVFTWSDYASSNENAECDESSLVGGAGCRGHYCDDVRLSCLTSGSTVVSDAVSYWTSSVSEETAPMVCKDDHFVTAISCEGYYCDNIALKCTSSDGRITGGNCAWSAWVSEEGTGTLMFGDDMYARGMECRGSYCDDKRFYVCSAEEEHIPPSIVPSWLPYSSYSAAPSYYTTVPPVATPSEKPSDFTRCEPTSGQCATTSDELQSMLTAASKHDVVSICDGTAIASSRTITNAVPNLTLCCDGSGCGIENDGTSANFANTGTTFIVKDITFSNGNSAESRISGGNLRIDADGKHEITRCTFSGGTSAHHGGNMSVQKAASVTVTDSTFSGGSAKEGAGGGLFVYDTPQMTVQGCRFSENDGQDGGAMYMYMTTGYEFRIQDSDFTSNTASVRAAALKVGVTTTMGKLATLHVLNSTFKDNVVTPLRDDPYQGNGGAGDFGSGEWQRSVEYTLAGNSGSGNSHAGNSCDGFFFQIPANTYTLLPNEYCHAVDEDIRH